MATNHKVLVIETAFRNVSIHTNSYITDNIQPNVIQEGDLNDAGVTF